MKRALVTGASGFIGRAVVARLRATGWRVVRAVRRDADAEDICLGTGWWDRASFARAIEWARPHVVFHLAGTAIGNTPAEIYQTNALLAVELLEAVRASAAPPAVLLAGSAAEYGRIDAERLPVGETEPCQPITDYGISKYAQTLVGLARARAGMNVTIARIFNVVGPGMPHYLALASFARQLRSGTDTLHVGDLDVARDFIDVTEAARIIVALGSEPAYCGGVYNVCSGEPACLRPLVEALVALCHRPVGIVVDPSRLRAGEMRVFTGDTSRLKAAGLSPAAPDFARLLPQLLAG